jgi:TonB family protein
LPKTLAKKKVVSFVRAGLARSLAIHGFVLLIALASAALKWISSSDEDEAKRRAMMQKQAIRVDIVDLPRMKMDELQKVDLTKEVKKEVEDETPPPPPPPSKTAMIDKTQTVEKKKEPEPKVSEQVKRIRERLRADMKRRELIAKLKSKQQENEEGRELVAGNKVSEGYSLHGDIASELDAYNGKARAHLQKNWNVPGWMLASNLSSRVLVKIAPDGRVISKNFLKRSGNSEFDMYISKAIEAADPLPPPPDALKKTFMEDGIEWGFPN